MTILQTEQINSLPPTVVKDKLSPRPTTIYEDILQLLTMSFGYFNLALIVAEVTCASTFLSNH